uniref:Glycosyl hydrolase n=1 Tax=Heterorhabditis bacteriophora TaxID=37862 RepID=A0A1I7WBT7_HETBA
MKNLDSLAYNANHYGKNQMLGLILAILPLAYCQSPLTKAWNEALPGVQPFWEKYQTGPHGVRHAVTNKQGSKGWQVIPCQGWNIIDGCDGVGSWLVN